MRAHFLLLIPSHRGAAADMIQLAAIISGTGLGTVRGLEPFAKR
jgi:hypothetical protein